MKQINEQINPIILQQTQKLLQFTKLLRSVVPVECHNHVQVANIRNQTLMLITDSPVWTTRLRQLSPQILQFVQNNMFPSESEDNKSKIIHHIQINTRYQTAAENTPALQKKARRKLQISEATAELLSQSANSLENEQLKAALLKVSRHVAEKPKK